MIVDDSYVPVSSFKEVYENIIQLTTSPIHNLIYKFKISVSSLRDIVFFEANEDAKFWQSEECPKHLHFSHKQYFKESGIAHVQEELARKANSKRALISLISQDDINGSGDKPIPSFMTAQYAVSGEDLYSTFYYRALETSSFLKINLEEFRMMADQVKPQNITHICGTIFSFYAYQNAGFANLKKNKLDYIEQPELLSYLENPGADLCGLLEELKNASSVISSNGVKSIKGWLDANQIRKGRVGIPIGTPSFLEKICSLIEQIDTLSLLLSKAANARQIEDARAAVATTVNKLVEQIRRV